jgi:dihydropyrimidinase
VPNGIPGVAARLPILFSEGVKKGRISLSDFVALTATNHAKMYGLYPRKGSIMVGADADIAIWDPDKTVILSQDLMQQGSDYTPYEGMEVTGWPIKTLLRGTLVADNGEVIGAPGFGQFQVRQTTQSA